MLAILNHRSAPCRFWRNNVGVYQPDPAHRPNIRIAYGLGRGSADLIGIVKSAASCTALFAAVEIKTPVGRLSADQKAWRKTIEELGGIYRVIRSEEEAQAFVEWLRGINLIRNNGGGSEVS